MNYAALLAVLAVLAFGFPWFVRLAARQGFEQAWAIGAALSGALLVLAWHLIRGRVERHRAATARLERIEAQIEAAPLSWEAYFADGEHLGEVLSALGRQREALAAFERYLELTKTDARDGGPADPRAGGRAVVEQRASRLRHLVSSLGG